MMGKRGKSVVIKAEWNWRDTSVHEWMNLSRSSSARRGLIQASTVQNRRNLTPTSDNWMAMPFSLVKFYDLPRCCGRTFPWTVWYAGFPCSQFSFFAKNHFAMNLTQETCKGMFILFHSEGLRSRWLVARLVPMLSSTFWILLWLLQFAKL